MIVYVKGIELIREKICRRIDPVAIIVVLALYIAYQEIATIVEYGVFASQYNFFRL